MNNLRLLLAVLVFNGLAFPVSAQIVAPGHVIGNGSAASRTPTDYGLGLVLDQALGAANGSLAYRNGGSWGQLTLGSGVDSALRNTAGGTGGFMPVAGGSITGQNTITYNGDWFLTGNTNASKMHVGGYATASGSLATLIGGGDFAHWYFNHNVATPSNGTWTTTDDSTSTSYSLSLSDGGLLTVFEAPAVGGAGAPTFVSTPTFQLNMLTGALKLNGNAVVYSGGPLGTPSGGSAANLTNYPTTSLVTYTGGSAASAGAIGEVISSSIAVGSAVSLSTGVAKNITSVSLTAGDWDCGGSVITNPAGSTTTSNFIGGMSGSTNTLPTAPAGGYAASGTAAAAGLVEGITLSRTQFNSSGSQTVYLVAQATFAVSTMSGYGQISCRRVR